MPKMLSAAGKLREWLIEKALLTSAIASVAAVVLIFVFVGREALPILLDRQVQAEAGLSKLFLPLDASEDSPRYVWQPISSVPKYSLVPLIIGTLKVTLIALLVAVPLGVGAAIYTAEFAPMRLRELIKPAIELLAGIPSVVLGFFALMVLADYVDRLLELLGISHTRLNAINAGIALGLAVVPIIYTISEDAINTVPRSFREASLALGATDRQTLQHAVLPAALPGIFAGLALGFGRAISETMIVLMASGNAAIASWDLTVSFRTLAATIGQETGEVVFGSPHYHVLFFIGALLFISTFTINLFGSLFINKMKAKLAGT